MPPEPSEESELSRKNLRASLADGASYSVMLALGETNFQLFAVALAAGETLVGLVATVPMMLAAVIQLLAPAALKWIGNYQRWIVWSSALQAAALLLLPVSILLPGNWGNICVLVATTLYWTGVMSCGPAWNTWIEGMLPISMRTRFLTSRARLSQICSMAGFLGGGIAIQSAASLWTDRNLPAPSSVLYAFVILFLIAAAARFFSVACLAKHRSPNNALETNGPTILEFFRGQAAGPGSQLIFYLLAMQMAVQISGPFFIPYMLKERNISPFAVVIIFSVCFLGKALAMPLWGRIAHQLGARRLFWLGGIAIMPMSILWIAADYFGNWNLTLPIAWNSDGSPLVISGMLLYLAGVQFMSGVTWSAYELAMSLMFLEAIPRDHRTKFLTYYNFGNASAMMLGSMIGGAILWNLAESQYGYMVIFGLSSVARCGVLVGFAVGAPELLWGPRLVPVAAVAELRPQLRVIFPDEVPVVPALSESATISNASAAERATAV